MITPTPIRLRLRLTLLALAAPLGSSAAQAPGVSAPGAPDNGAYVVMMGPDTVVVERFTRTADTLSARIAVRPPGGAAMQRVRFVAALGREQLVQEIQVSADAEDPTGNAAASATARVSFTTDSTGTVAHIGRAGSDQTLPMPTDAGAIPLINVSIALVEQVVRRARALPGDSVTVPLFQLQGGSTSTAHVRFVGDSAHMLTGSDRLTLRVDDAGRILGGGDPSRRIRIERVERVPAGWFDSRE